MNGSDDRQPQIDEIEGEPVPLSALQHAVYCLRQAALIHLERLWEENRFTAEGRVLHEVTDKGGQRKIKATRRVNALPLASRRLGIAGVADLVEFFEEGGREVAYPVEYKRGKPKPHRADEVQLCAQALCLEEMTGNPVREGALFYAETKRRLIVEFDEKLRRLTCETIESLREIFRTLKTPPPEYRAARCRACSLYDICRPKDVAQSARDWRARTVSDLLGPEEEPAV
ncbi:MAG: CRISPR-associated protein Cas4 [Alphaproteobacteria bacterium]|nr:CRISPR-associated protein Cas4 [Alphaproteobacteria bacterium]